MSPETLPDVSAADQDFARLWAESTSQVLESIHASPFTATPRGPVPVETAPEATADSLWIRFKASGALEGELAFRFAKRDGVEMAQLLMSVPIDPAALARDFDAPSKRKFARHNRNVENDGIFGIKRAVECMGPITRYDEFIRFQFRLIRQKSDSAALRACTVERALWPA